MIKRTTILKKLIGLLLFLAVQLLTPTHTLGQDKNTALSIAIMSVDAQQMAVYSRVFEQFQILHPNIKINLDFYSDARFKQNLMGWLENGQYDLLYWQAGNRLDSLVESRMLLPMEALVSQKSLHDSYHSASIKAVTYKGTVFALPLGHYAWGMYYNKKIFSRLGLKEPQTWEEFKQLCALLKENNVFPLVQAVDEGWPLLAWMDYLALESGGQSFRQKLVKAEVLSQADSDLLLNEFAQLISNDYFFAPDYQWQWNQTIAVLLREQAAMTLMGQFAEGVIPLHLSEQLGFFKFPFTHKENEQVAIAPLEVWVAPALAVNKDKLSLLVEYLSTPDVHEQLALELGWLPVGKSISSQKVGTERLQKGSSALQEAKTHLQFFDRDANQSLSDRIASGMTQAITQKNPRIINQVVTSQGKPITESVTNSRSQTDKTLNLATLAGLKGTFFSSRLLRLVYQQLGFDITIERFSDLTALSPSAISRLDGELGRTGRFGMLSPDFIQVPTAYSELKVVMVCNVKVYCEEKNRQMLKGQNIAMGISAALLRNWAKDQGLKISQYNVNHHMWADFVAGKVELILTPEAEAYENRALFGQSNYRTVIQAPVYHYLHKRHKALVKPVSVGLEKLKNSALYESLKRQYGINQL